MKSSLPYVNLVFCLACPKLYTVVVGGSMSSKAFHRGCMLLYLWDVYLVCCKIDWRQLDFSWAYPFTERDSKRMKTFKYLGSTLAEDGELDADIPPQCAERLEELADSVWSVG